jgi:V/A-type H+/Na+-transporting ATPase subunit E
MPNIKSGLTAIAAEVLEDIRKEAETTIQNSQNEAKQTLKMAKEVAEKAYSAIVDDAKTRADTEKRKIQSLTDVEKRNRLLQSKEELVNAAFEHASKHLGDFVLTSEYHVYLLNLINEVAGKLGAGKIVVQVNAADMKWLTRVNLNSIEQKMGVKLQLDHQALDGVGGCKVQTADGARVFDESFENRMEQLKPALRVEVAKILFSPEETKDGS